MRLRRLHVFLGSLVLLAICVLVAQASIPYLSAFATAAAAAMLFVGAVWGVWRLTQRFLWRVGRRLAFSYFLIGLVPIPLMLLLLGIVAYLLSSFFLGHLFRDAANGLHHDLHGAALQELAAFSGARRGSAAARPGYVFGYYENGKRVAGDPRLPAAWPEWLPAGEATGMDPEARKESVTPFVALPDGTPTVAAAAGHQKMGVVAAFDGEVDALLSAESDVFVRLMRSDDPEARSNVKLKVGTREYALSTFGGEKQTAASGAFFGQRDAGSRLWDRPILVWGEISGPYRSLADGAVVGDYMVAALRGTPRMVHRHLFSSNAEINTGAWALTIALTFILFDIYIAAAMMAVFLIFGLSRAVNRLSYGTEAVRRGIFSVRIPVRRKDQVGELQRSFNEMSAHLEELVQAAAQKEALEKELEIARSVQAKLIPSNPPRGERVEFATHFEPSAAIGGDYFDILELDRDRIAVVVADVSGHGLSAGLRMAMIKAGLQILVERSHDAQDILRRLDALVRQSDERRTFVTATLALFDLRSGRLEITNAGHPPVYLRRADQPEVEEILLPGSPLGALGQQYGRQDVVLQPGDVLVWLSDGLIEATDEAGQPFGYDRVRQTLAAGSSDPEELRDRLLGAVRRHSAGRPAEDDRTLVVMRYLPARRPTVEEPREATVAASVAAPSER